MKVCTKCLVEKSSCDFYLDNRTGSLRPSCKICCNASSKSHYRDNLDYYKIRNSIHYVENKDVYFEKDKRWRENNRDRSNEISRNYSKRNPEAVAQFAAKRRAKVRSQTPDLTPEESQRIKDMYWLARDLRAVSGEYYHVDHIVALANGGLHHPDNLQILPADINIKKGAR